MMSYQKVLGKGMVLLFLAGLLSSCTRHKYENPISKDTQQPDKVLFDKAIKDIEKGRYEVARLTLQTLINTYDTSEYLAKAKLAIADSWFREGGSSGLAQAEAEYKDFILFYPTMEEAAEAQKKVCLIHYKEMEKADRDTVHALRAEEECRQVLVQFPNSKFAPEVEQILRNIQEVLAEHEYRVGAFYHNKGSYPAAANRLEALTSHFPLYSQADEALWDLADSYGKMGPRFQGKSAAAFAKLVRDYPLSPLADDARKELTRMEKEIPEPDPVAVARMKYELANRQSPSMKARALGMFKSGPDTSMAAKSGTPVMESFRPTLPVTIPAANTAAAGTGVSADVSVSTVQDSSALDKLPDARQTPASDQAKPADSSSGQAASSSTSDATATSTSQGAQQTDQSQDPKQSKKKKKSSK